MSYPKGVFYTTKGNPTKYSVLEILRNILYHIEYSPGYAVYFFEKSVLFETGELNAYVYDVVGSTDGNTFRTEGKGRATTITLVDGKLLPCIATRV